MEFTPHLIKLKTLIEHEPDHGLRTGKAMAAQFKVVRAHVMKRRHALFRRAC